MQPQDLYVPNEGCSEGAVIICAALLKGRGGGVGQSLEPGDMVSVKVHLLNSGECAAKCVYPVALRKLTIFIEQNSQTRQGSKLGVRPIHLKAGGGGGIKSQGVECKACHGSLIS